MGNLAKYVFFMSTIIVLFYLAGLVDEYTSIDDFFKFVRNPKDLLTSEFWSEAENIFNAVALVGVTIIGAVTRNIQYIAKGSFVIYLANLFTAFLMIYDKVADVNVWIAMLIFSPLLVVLVLTIVEWVFGGD